MLSPFSIKSTLPRLTCVAVFVYCAACPDQTQSETDAGTPWSAQDAGAGADRDGGSATPPDAGESVPQDAGGGLGQDAGQANGPDAGQDAGSNPCGDGQVDYDAGEQCDDGVSCQFYTLDGGLTYEESQIVDFTDAGLGCISGVSGDLVIEFNASLTGLTGLENLKTIGGKLVIIEDHGLTDLAGLNNLQSIGSHLWIVSNLGLTDVSALHQVTQVGGEFLIHSNPSLATSDAEALRDAIGIVNIQGPITIDENGSD